MKNLVNLGRILNKLEQRTINGGFSICCNPCDAGCEVIRNCPECLIKPPPVK